MTGEKKNSKLTTLVTRSVTGALLVAILISGITLNTYTFLSVFLIIVSLSLWEFFRLVNKSGQSSQVIYGIFLGVSVFVCNYLYASSIIDARYFVLLIPLFVLTFIIELYRKKSHPFTNVAYTFLGVLYIAVPFSLLCYFVHDVSADGYIYKYEILLGFFFLVWTYDTGAYLAGISFGKNKLFERISPKKSWEGVFGGAVAAMVIAWVLSVYYTDLNLTDWFVIAAIVIVFGTYGDLTESLLKRSTNIKDSSNILPGHGGVLDRFDAILLAAPVIFTYLTLFVE